MHVCYRMKQYDLYISELILFIINIFEINVNHSLYSHGMTYFQACFMPNFQTKSIESDIQVYYIAINIK